DMGYMAIVDGTRVPIDLYSQTYSMLEDRYRSQFGGAWSPDLARQFGLAKQAYDQVIDEVLMNKEAARLNIKVSDHAVEQALKAQSIFRDDTGKFDPQKWNAVVASPNIPWDQWRDQLRSQLALQTLVQTVTSGARVSPDEIKEKFIAKNTKAKVKYLAITPSTLSSDIKVSDEDIKAHYEKTKEKYKLPDRRKLDFVSIPIEPSADDEAQTRKKAETVLEKAKSGADFSELATQYSDGPTASKGGDLGLFGKGRMDPAFEKAAFALKPGEISGIVKSRFGLHIIKVEEKTKNDKGEPQIRARHILFKIEASDKTIDALFNKAESLAADAKKDGASLETAAKAHGFEVQQTDFFAADVRYLPVIGEAADIADEAFSMPIGYVSDSLKTRDAYIVFQVKEEQPAHIQPLDDVKSRVKRELQLERAATLLEPRIREIAGKIKSLDDLKDVDPKLAALVRTSDFFSKEDFVPGVGRTPEFMDAAFSLKPGTLSKPIVVGDRLAILLNVIERTPADMTKLDEQKDSIRDELLREKKSRILEDWRKSLLEQATIVPSAEIVAQWAEPEKNTTST
ncbi:MAG: peptidylprolyl isomerase, partial [Candidatus Hydrogenedentes bacterium]|nr:peptidylprolyl isomerase [Candidatus Hydrogenedentota bacterium]